MSYGSAADDEGVLSYSNTPKQPTTATMSTATASKLATSAHNGTNTSVPMPSSSAGGGAAAAPGDVGIGINSPSIIGQPSVATDRVAQYARHTWSQCRPWSHFYSTSAVSIPPFAALSDRFSTNLHLYRANYQVLAVFWLSIVFLGSIPSFLLAALLFFLIERWCTRRANKNANVLSHRDIVIAAFASLVVVWITGIATQILISLSISTVFVAIHAALHEPSENDTEITTV